MMRTKKIEKNVLKAVLCFFLVICLSNFFSIRAYASGDELEEAQWLIKNYYVDDIPDSKLNSASTVEELVAALNDPYSQYFTTQGYNDFVNSINNRVCGIGVKIEAVSEGVKINSVFKDSPALKAGLKPEDIIIEADGHSLAGLTLDEASSYIKGEEGTSVSIKVKSGGNYYTYSIVRQQINAPTVEGKMLDGGTAYIELSSFGEDTKLEFDGVLNDLKKQDPVGYIIDLRNNPGGYLLTARELAEYFIGGESPVLLKDRWGTSMPEPVKSDIKMVDKPVAFLINENSASASEVLTAAVKDYKKAFIIGSTSYGKGTVQMLFGLTNGGYLKLTVQRFFSPLGNPINKVGVTPDLQSGEADPVKIAQILLEGKNIRDNESYVNVKIKGREFNIDLNKARLQENWQPFRKIVESALSSEGAFLKTPSGSMGIVLNSIDDLWRVYFPGYNGAKKFKDVAADNEFTVSFKDSVNASSIGSRDIELINSLTGERTPLKIENIDSKTIKVSPENALLPGQVYYLVEHGSIKYADGRSMGEGTVSVVSVK